MRVEYQGYIDKRDLLSHQIYLRSNFRKTVCANPALASIRRGEGEKYCKISREPTLSYVGYT
jgi:hypothetical protein